jgi:hypothetical protein
MEAEVPLIQQSEHHLAYFKNEYSYWRAWNYLSCRADLSFMTIPFKEPLKLDM